MKQGNVLLAVICVLLAGSLLGCSGVRAVDTSRAESIRLDQIGSLALNGDELMKQMEAGKQLMVFAAKGQTLPADILLDFPFVKTREGRALLEFSQDTYLLISKQAFMISPDGQNWAAIHDAKGIKKLYNAQQGSLNIGFAADQGSGPTMKLSVELH